MSKSCKRCRPAIYLLVVLQLLLTALTAPALAETVRSVQSGNWSEPATWHNNSVPAFGARVLIDSGHTVVYDLFQQEPIRRLHIRGTLSFSRKANTWLQAGLIILSPVKQIPEKYIGKTIFQQNSGNPFHLPKLEIGTPEKPIPSKIIARITLVHFPDMDPRHAPAILHYQGRIEIHGAAISPAWTPLARLAPRFSSRLKLASAVNWQRGDRVIVTGTAKAESKAGSQTESALLSRVSGTTVRLDQPLIYSHRTGPKQRALAANITRNVIIESPSEASVRGYVTCFANGSAGISNAEFVNLGKAGQQSRHPLQFKMMRKAGRGSYVSHCVFVNSDNRWIVNTGSDYIAIRHNIGYKSAGSGFVWSYGSESCNLVEGNLAIQARSAAVLPNSPLPFDANRGDGFWWANARNVFMNNVVSECDGHAFHFASSSEILLSVLQPDGSYSGNSIIDEQPLLWYAGNEGGSPPAFRRVDLHRQLVQRYTIPEESRSPQQIDRNGPTTIVLYPAPYSSFPADTRNITVRGTCLDEGAVVGIRVNGQQANPIDDSFWNWEVNLLNLTNGPMSIVAMGVDQYGNREINPHVVPIMIGEPIE